MLRHISHFNQWYKKWVFIGLCLISIVNAQTISVKDSLLHQLKICSIDTIKVEILEGLAGETYFENPVEAQGYCEQMKLISEKVGFKRGLVASYGWLAYLYEQQGKIDLALQYNFKSVQLAIDLNDKKSLAALYNNIAAIYKNKGDIDSALYFDKKTISIRMELADLRGISVSLNNVGFIYFGQGKINEALVYYERSMLLAEALADWQGVAISLGNIADVYADQGELNSAIECHFKAIELYRRIKDKYSMAYSLNSLGGVYERAHNYKMALKYFFESKSIREEIDDKQGLGYVLTNIGDVYFKQHKLELALNNYTVALNIFAEVDDPMGLANVTYLLSEYYLLTGDKGLSKKYGEESLRLSKELGFPYQIRNASGMLYKIYQQESDWKKAFETLQIYELMNDSLVNDDTRKAAIKQKIGYEYDKKSLEERLEYERQMEVDRIELQKRRVALFSIGGIVLLLLVLVIAVYKGKKKSDHLLLNILPSETARELKRNGSAKTRQYNEVTVLFTDFKGFTQIAEKLTPDELVAEINTCFSAFDVIMEKYKIEKIKTIGDAYMAAGGLPVNNTTHPSDVVMAALDIVSFMNEHGMKRKKEGKLAFQIRIGIHTGPVIAGIVGIKKFAYDIWGDTVNTASRMESSGEAGKVNISESTYNKVKNYFTFEYRGKIEAKNKGQIDMYFVTDKTSHLNR